MKSAVSPASRPATPWTARAAARCLLDHFRIVKPGDFRTEEDGRRGPGLLSAQEGAERELEQAMRAEAAAVAFVHSLPRGTREILAAMTARKREAVRIARAAALATSTVPTSRLQ